MIIKMKIIVVLVLDIFFYSSLSVQDGSDDIKKVFCGIGNEFRRKERGYKFDISQLPERCESIVVAEYLLDNENGVPITNSDISIIKTLKDANKHVYTVIGLNQDQYWGQIFDPANEAEFNKILFDPLIKFIETSKINGIIIYCYMLYDIVLTNFEKKITGFVSKIKEKIKNIKVGFYVDSYYYKRFNDISLFDFSLINEAIDLYFINWSILNICSFSTKKTGLSPAISNDPYIFVTGEMVTNMVLASKMSQNKIYAMIEMTVVIPIELQPENSSPYTTYSKYCSSQDSSDWCISTSNVSYGQGVYIKKKYHGIFIYPIDADDFDEKCGCGKFPVTNLIMDGWEGSNFKTCPKLN